MNYILGGGGFSSRLYREVREKRGLAYSVFTNLQPMKLSGLISGGVGTKNNSVADSLSVIRSEWVKMRDKGITDEELKHAKAYLIGSFPLRLSSTDRVARMLVAIQRHKLGLNYIQERKNYISNISKTEVNEFASRLLDPEQLSFVIVGRPDGKIYKN